MRCRADRTPGLPQDAFERFVTVIGAVTVLAIVIVVVEEQLGREKVGAT